MNKIKACRGCFAQMDAEDEKCYKCGWKVGDKFPDKYRWKLGDVLQKRYLVGTVYYSSEKKDITVFYVYDNFLSVSCMALIRKKKDIEAYVSVARHLENSRRAKEGKIVILGLKEIEKRYVLFFSMENRYMATEVFEACLESKIKAEKETDRKEMEISGLKNTLPAKTMLDGRYLIRDCIGIGGFGITYLCQDTMLKRLVAVKEYFPEQWAERDDTYVSVKQAKMLQAYQFGMKSFLKEITIAAKFIHTPHVASVYDAFHENDTLYMVMEYVDGISVGKMMKECDYRPMEPAQVAQVISPVLDALEVMHDKKVVHSDISPGNIMYAGEELIYLIDMGAAKYTMDRQPSLSAIFLKVEYAAPEQYRTAVERKPSGEGPWTDIYALGATMYYMLTGTKPTDVISRLSGNDEDLSEKLDGKLPKEWVDFLQKAMALDKDKRIHSVPEFRMRMKKLTLEKH